MFWHNKNEKKPKENTPLICTNDPENKDDFNDYEYASYSKEKNRFHNIDDVMSSINTMTAQWWMSIPIIKPEYLIPIKDIKIREIPQKHIIFIYHKNGSFSLIDADNVDKKNFNEEDLIEKYIEQDSGIEEKLIFLNEQTEDKAFFFPKNISSKNQLIETINKIEKIN